MGKNILITPHVSDSSLNPRIDFTGDTSGNIRLEVLSDGTIAFIGNSGSLFSITDDVSGTLMAVSDMSGMPILEVLSTYEVDVNGYLINDGSIRTKGISIIYPPINTSDGTNKWYVDSCINLLRSDINSSIGWLKTYVDSSLATRDTAIQARLKEASLGTTFLWGGGILDVSLSGGGVTQSYVDNADNWIKSRYIPDASLNQSTFKWIAGLLEPSIAGSGSVSQAYVDGSLYALNTSVGNAFASNASLGFFWNITNPSVGRLDTSIRAINPLVFSSQPSIGYLLGTTEASLGRINSSLNQHDSSIRVLWTLNNTLQPSLAYVFTNIEGSLGRLDVSIRAINPLVYALEPSIGYLIGTTEASLGRIDTSIRTIWTLQTVTQSSIGYLFSITEPSVGKLDTSIRQIYPIVLISNTSIGWLKTYIDGSLYTLNTSIGNALASNASLGFFWNITNPSVGRLDTSIRQHDTSIRQLWTLNLSIQPSLGYLFGITEASVGRLDASTKWWKPYVDGSLYTLNASINNAFASNSSLGFFWNITNPSVNRIDVSLRAIYPLVFTTNTSLGSYVLKTGDTMTGALIINASVYIDGSISINNLTNASTNYILYYNTTTKEITYGSAAAGAGDVTKAYVDASLNLKYNKIGGLISGDVSIQGNLTVTGSIFNTNASIGQSILSAGLIVNNSGGGDNINDFQVKTDSYYAIDVSARNDAMTLMSNALGKLAFFGVTPTSRNTGWTASNGSGDKVLNVSSTTLNEVADILATLINELKNKGLIG